MLVFYYYIGKKQHILASLRKAEQNIFVPSGLATGVFEELPEPPDWHGGGSIYWVFRGKFTGIHSNYYSIIILFNETEFLYE